MYNFLDNYSLIIIIVFDIYHFKAVSYNTHPILTHFLKLDVHQYKIKVDMHTYHNNHKFLGYFFLKDLDAKGEEIIILGR